LYAPKALAQRVGVLECAIIVVKERLPARIYTDNLLSNDQDSNNTIIALDHIRLPRSRCPFIRKSRNAVSLLNDAMTEVQVVKTVDGSKYANIEKIILTQ